MHLSHAWRTFVGDVVGACVGACTSYTLRSMMLTAWALLSCSLNVKCHTGVGDNVGEGVGACACACQGWFLLDRPHPIAVFYARQHAYVHKTAFIKHAAGSNEHATVCKCMSIHQHIIQCLHASTLAYIHTCMYAYIHTYIHASMHTNMQLTYA